jgi:hypothetical protein
MIRRLWERIKEKIEKRRLKAAILKHNREREKAFENNGYKATADYAQWRFRKWLEGAGSYREIDNRDWEGKR